MKFLILLFLIPSLSQASEVSLSEFLKISWQQNPISDVSKLQNEEFEQWEKSGRGRYMPHLSAEVIDSTGFPGSTSTLHIGGLMGSPYRKGVGAGVIWDQLLYDFGRTSSLLRKYKADQALAEAQVSAEKYQQVAHLVSLYMNCARAKSELKEQNHLIELGDVIARETKRMSNTGQKTLVEESLTRIDLDDLKMEKEDFKSDLDRSRQEMLIYVGKNQVDCAEMNSKSSQENFDDYKITAPQLLIAKAKVKSSQALADSANDEQLPILTATGSYGYLQDDRLVTTKDNYALGIGLIFPFFNGGEDYHKKQAYRIRSEFGLKEIELAQQEFQAHITRLDARINQLKADLSSLDTRVTDADKTTTLALKRFVHLQGQLVDVRESFKRLHSLEAEKLKLVEELVISELERQIVQAPAE
jgi:outer membrane protein TolC